MRIEAPDWEIGELLDMSPAPDAAPIDTPERKQRAWLTGEVVLEPPDVPSQGQRFANWARSRLTTHFGVEPPEGYTGVTYRHLKARQDTET